MVSMGYSRKEVEESLVQNKYDHLQATYLLLGRHGTDVCHTYHIFIHGSLLSLYLENGGGLRKGGWFVLCSCPRAAPRI